jgi:hypothetical protein
MDSQQAISEGKITSPNRGRVSSSTRGGQERLHYELAQQELSITEWSWMVVALYIGIRFLNFGNRIIRYANEAVLPFYILHHLMIVGITFFLVRWEMNMVVRFLLVSTLALVTTLGVYELLIKRVSVARWMFGMKPRKREDSHNVSINVH